MLGKKIFALGCAIAIVALGACFLPHDHVPPPALPPYLGHVHHLSIEVRDTSGQDLFDESAMSQAVASNFNELWKDFSVRAKPVQAAKPSDAVLRIAITHKSASGGATGKQAWTFDLNSSLTLTSTGGRVLWQRGEENTRFRLSLEDGLPPDAWNSRVIQHEAAYWLAMRSGDVLLDLPFRYSSEKHR